MKISILIFVIIAVSYTQASLTCDKILCPVDHTCNENSVVDCTFGEGCFTKITAACVPQLKSGICPIQDITHSSKSTCKYDGDCGSNLKCCSNNGNSFCTKPCKVPSCKCQSGFRLVGEINPKGCPVCNCVNDMLGSRSVPAAAPKPIEDACSQPKVVGICKASLRRFFFNAETNSCESFLFGGCQANKNNFLSKSDCEAKCLKDLTPKTNTKPVLPKCEQEADSGMCRSYYERYFYNTTAKECQQFVYGGCQGNENNFLSLTDCNTECNANTVQETSALIEKPFDASNCQLERDSGPCFAYFEQFFFNKNSQKCEMFVYGGCLGNENRFKTLQDCQKSCEAIAAKKPFDKASCNLDRDSGPCFAYFENFFYNKNSKKCETFVYGGCLGNENRFVTRKECENSCLTQNNVVDKPKEDVCKLKSDGGMCRARIERFFYNDTAKECQKFNYGGCQGNGNNFETKEACDKKCSKSESSSVKEDVCKLGIEAGPCYAYLEVYGFNSKKGICEKFVYGGCLGNSNRFKTKAECEQSCKTKTISAKDICSLKSDTGFCRGHFERYAYNPTTQKCSMFVYGGCGGNANNFESFGECSTICKDSESGGASEIRAQEETVFHEDYCYKPVEVGPGRAYIPSYFYNPSTKECEFFAYGGIQGNENRFKSKEECEKSCTPKPNRNKIITTSDICSMKAKSGPCLAYFEKYYFNKQTNSCEKFIYGGCGGNLNNFEDKDQCENVCSPDDSDEEFDDSEEEDEEGVVDDCSLPKKAGKCKAFFERFFFNTASQKCERFIYGGCQANANNFETIEACESKCNSD